MKKIILILIIGTLIGASGCLEKREYTGNNINTKICYDNVNNLSFKIQAQKNYEQDIAECDNIVISESYNFQLKEMKQKDLMKGEFSGSFLLIGGSIYGRVEEKMYLVVTYFDTRVPAYKITKFDLEQLEINTIDKNKSAYFKYKVMPYKDNWNIDKLKFDKLIPVLYLPEGWAII